MKREIPLVLIIFHYEALCIIYDVDSDNPNKHTQFLCIEDFGSTLGTGPPRGKYVNADTPESSGFAGFTRELQLVMFWFLPKFVTIHVVLHISIDLLLTFLLVFQRSEGGLSL